MLGWRWWRMVAGAGAWMVMTSGCRPVESPPPPPVDTSPCDDPEHLGCPGMPCAHESCFVGVCEGVLRDDAGQLIDPGVCCDGDECLAP